MLNALAAALRGGNLPTLSTHRLRHGLPGYLILFATHAFEPQRQLQTPIRTETGFLGLAQPHSIATLCTGHCSMREAQDIRGMMI